MQRRSAAVASLLLLTLGACRRSHTTEQDIRLANKVSSRSVTLYYETPELLLGPEQRTLSLPENDAAAIPIVVRELLKGSSNAAVPHLLPTDVVARGVYTLADGTAIVDLGGNSLGNGWSAGSHAELMALYSIVTTLTSNFPAITKVRFLVNGQVVETLGGHVAIDHPLRPSSAFVVPANPAKSVAAK